MYILNRELIDCEDFGISIKSPSIRYGLLVFDAINIECINDTILIFRLNEHIERFLLSCKHLGLKTEQDEISIREDCLNLIKNAKINKTMGLRLLAFYDKEASFLTVKKASIVIYLLDVQNMYLKNNDKLMISDYQKCINGMMPASIKTNATYAYFRIAVQKAIDCGFSDVIFLNTDGYVTESSRSNIFIISENKVITPPISSGVLKGITRDTIISIANNMHLVVEEKNICRTELYDANAVFTTGTSLGITKISQVDHVQYKTNELLEKIIQEYKNIIKDENNEWNTKVQK